MRSGPLLAKLACQHDLAFSTYIHGIAARGLFAGVAFSECLLLVSHEIVK
jgi:hypothetical protein